MITRESLLAKFSDFERKILSDEISDAENDEAVKFIADHRVQLREIMGKEYDARCEKMADHLLTMTDRILARKSDGCGKCRGCQMVQEARRRVAGTYEDYD